MSLFTAALLLATPAFMPEASASVVVIAQVTVRDIAVGDPLRRQLLDALRPVIENDLDGQPVQFMVDRLRVDGDWAFFSGSVQRPDGGPIDFERTHYIDAIEFGVFDGPATFALLRLGDETWQVVTFAIGPSDVTYAGWSEEFGAPDKLFE